MPSNGGGHIDVDLRDREATISAFRDHESVRTVIHLASSIEVGIGENTPLNFMTIMCAGRSTC